MKGTMADSSEPKQDFAPPWLKFPPAEKINGVKPGNRPRRDDPYAARPDFHRLQRQASFDFHEGKRFHPGPGPKYRHHSVEDEYYMNYPYSYGYYPSPAAYNYERMHYSSQPALGRGGKFFPPRPSQGVRRGGYHDKDFYRDARGYRDERDRPFSDDFPSLVGGKGEPRQNGDTKKTSKPGSGVWENPPKSNGRNEDSSDLLKNSSPGIYKALVSNKTGSSKKAAKEGVRMNGNVRDSSPLSPSNKSNKEGSRQSPTPEIVTQPKKLGDKKSEFLKTLRKESSLRNGDTFQDQGQNAIGKKQVSTSENETPMIEDGNVGSEDVNGEKVVESDILVASVNGDGGETLISDVDQINLKEDDEEKKLLLAMGWDEEDDTEYVITDDEIKEFQDLLQNHCHGQKPTGLKPILRNVLSKNFANGLNGSNDAESQSKPL